MPPPAPTNMVPSLAGSTATLRTSLLGSPALMSAQFAPPSVDLNSPSSQEPTYTVEGSSGSTAIPTKAPSLSEFGSPALIRTHNPPPFVDLNTPAVSVPAYRTFRSEGSMGSGSTVVSRSPRLAS